MSRPRGHRPAIHVQARRLASGTIATLTGHTDYETIDRVQYDFVHWTTEAVKADPDRFESWQEAWIAFSEAGRPRRLES